MEHKKCQRNKLTNTNFIEQLQSANIPLFVVLMKRGYFYPKISLMGKSENRMIELVTRTKGRCTT